MNPQSEDTMGKRPLVMIGVGVIVLWVVLWLVFRVVAFFVHILVVVGLLLILWGLLKRGRQQIGERFGSRSNRV
jgi:Flp pilus assembly protein TadB